MSDKKSLDYTYIEIIQKALPLKCSKCEHPWYYKPQNTSQPAKVVTCPKCRAMVTIRKAMVIDPSRLQATTIYNQVSTR
jgi:Zn finger protein HypA/HybF involved in hydrogenase expression